MSRVMRMFAVGEGVTAFLKNENGPIQMYPATREAVGRQSKRKYTLPVSCRAIVSTALFQ